MVMFPYLIYVKMVLLNKLWANVFVYQLFWLTWFIRIYAFPFPSLGPSFSRTHACRKVMHQTGCRKLNIKKP